MAVAQTTQLKFNLDERMSLSNLKVAFNKPKPIIIEKFDESATPGPQATSHTAAQMQFSVLSEEYMTEAVALARRDLKKQREQQQQQLQEHQVARKPSRGVKVPHRRDYRDRLQKRESRLGQMLPKENSSPKKTRSVTTRSQHLVQSQPSVQGKQKAAVVSGALENPYRRAVDSNSQEERLVEEIRRLRHETEMNLEQVKEAVEMAYSEPKRGASKYAEEIEADRKRRVRADQHNTRCSRSLYQLQQQVAAVQTDIDTQAKAKPSILAAVAAVHRGSLRTLTTLLHHMGDFRLLEEGLPRTYKELSLLLTSLHSCCQQMGIVSRSDTTLDILQQIQELHVDTSMNSCNHSATGQRRRTTKAVGPHGPHGGHDTSPRRGSIKASITTGRSPKSSPRGRSSKTSPSRRSPKTSPSRRSPKTSPSRRSSKTSPRGRSPTTSPRGSMYPKMSQKAHGRKPLIEKQVVSKAPMHHRVAKGKHTAERQRALRAGVSSLVRAAESPRPPHRKLSAANRKHQQPKVPPLRLPSTPRSKAHRTSKRSVTATAPSKGILFPMDIQRHRRPTTIHKTVSMGDVHYLEPTVSSMLKEADPDDLPRTRSRSTSPSSHGRSRSLTPRGRTIWDDSLERRRSRSLSPGVFSLPRSGRSPSARSPSARSLSARSLNGRSQSPGRNMFDNATERAIRSQIRMDQQAASQFRSFDRLRRDEKQRLRDLKREVDPEGHWVFEAEDRIRARLEPLLRRAQASMNADVLADSILGEVLEDTARHMQDFQDEEEMEEHAMALMDSPTLQQILQRMTDMENEENLIRRRWATISYDDTHTNGAKYIDAPYSERPTAPEPLLLVAGQNKEDLTLPIPGSQAMLYDAGAIVFTKPPQHAVFTAHDLALFPPAAAAASVKKPRVAEVIPVDLYLSPQMITNIRSHQAKYDKYLKNQSYQRKGKFDPWKIVQEISDDVLNTCIKDVSEELVNINDDIVLHVYQTEFAKVPEGTGMNVAVPPAHSSAATLEQFIQTNRN